MKCKVVKTLSRWLLLHVKMHLPDFLLDVKYLNLNLNKDYFVQKNYIFYYMVSCFKIFRLLYNVIGRRMFLLLGQYMSHNFNNVLIL